MEQDQFSSSVTRATCNREKNGNKQESSLSPKEAGMTPNKAKEGEQELHKEDSSLTRHGSSQGSDRTLTLAWARHL